MKSTIIFFSIVVTIFFNQSSRASQKNTYLLLPIPKNISYENCHTIKPLCSLKRVEIIDPNIISNEQGYRLNIRADEILISANNEAGVFYANQTLKQILKQVGRKESQCLTITDWPDYPVRGVMLDISRDKVPTMHTLYDFVEMLAGWKINHFELYTEHTFAYKNHKEVWKNASPMTAEQIRKLDKFCRERFIDLVPNQNSFGHMNRWLEHPDYQYLAEATDYVDTQWGKRRLNDLYPGDPNTIKFIAGLYDELLPNFSSRYFNVGCDEVMELGNGRSKELCSHKDRDEVYVEYLLKIYQEVKKHNSTMMFWADMIQQKPEIMSKLPNDAIALIWGYEAEHPFDKYCKTVALTGRNFYVCPGTSTWRSISGRTDNAIKNLLNAAENGRKFGATGYIITDWGDMGDWEPIIAGYPEFAYGAALSWSLNENRDINLPAVLNEFAFDDKACVTGSLVYDLGNAYKLTDTQSNPLIAKLLLYPDFNLDKESQSVLTINKLQATKVYVDNVLANLEKTNIKTQDAAIIRIEIKFMADMLKHGCDLAMARLDAKDKKTINIPQDVRDKLAFDMKKIMKDYKKVWLSRNRRGGLSDSLSRMENQLELYEQK
ncbi:MAG: family 20 glycosylhydrolase [Phycisphaerales bacterium]